MLYIKDSNLIADDAYQELAIENQQFLNQFKDHLHMPNKYPSLYAIQQSRAELNATFSVQPFPNRKGVQERLEAKLRF